ncbi:hypothetical protein O3P69_009866 [Scylla paramamosain]|uniref:Uncharacterized protein n=1 Tax=Scylla paramamosain TaxID=85552 RepID=A0AAW0SNY1_SCYPA
MKAKVTLLVAMRKRKEVRRRKRRKDKGKRSCVVETLVGGVPEEQHLREHHHALMYGGSSLAAFVKRRRKEKELIKRFEEVESWVNERDPKLARDLYILRETHLAYEMTWCRIKYHPSLLKVSGGDEGHENNQLSQVGDSSKPVPVTHTPVSVTQVPFTPSPHTPVHYCTCSCHPCPLLHMYSSLTCPNHTCTLSGIKPPRIPPRINILWRVRLSAAEKEKQERRRRLMQVREDLKGSISVASMNGSVRGGFGSLRAGSFVSLARQYQPRPVGLSSLTPLEAALDEETGLSHSRCSFLPVRENSSSFLPPPSYSALKSGVGWSCAVTLTPLFPRHQQDLERLQDFSGELFAMALRLVFLLLMACSCTMGLLTGPFLQPGKCLHSVPDIECQCGAVNRTIHVQCSCLPVKAVDLRNLSQEYEVIEASVFQLVNCRGTSVLVFPGTFSNLNFIEHISFHNVGHLILEPNSITLQPVVDNVLSLTFSLITNLSIRKDAINIQPRNKCTDSRVNVNIKHSTLISLMKSAIVTNLQGTDHGGNDNEGKAMA